MSRDPFMEPFVPQFGSKMILTFGFKTDLSHSTWNFFHPYPPTKPVILETGSSKYSKKRALYGKKDVKQTTKGKGKLSTKRKNRAKIGDRFIIVVFVSCSVIDFITHL